MSSIIKIENLSKKYVIGHQRQERYSTLRDVMMHKIRGIGERLCHPLSPNKEETSLEEFWALKDINLEIKPGERVGIIGHNGAGKSTLLKILSRITEPTTGRIKIKGRVASLLEVGTGFHPELTGRENIFLNGAILGMSRVDIRKNFDEIVAFAEVEKFLDTPVRRYSSGMYVRLAFAVAAHLESEILIVDEVLAVGDVEFQKKCLGKMQDVSKGRRTVLFVSHNMNAVNRLCSKSILLNSGQIVCSGNTSEVVGKYLDEDKTAKKIVNHVLFNEQNDKDVHIREVYLLNDAGKLLKAPVSVTERFFLKIVYVVNRPIRQLHLNFYIRNFQDDIVLFSDRRDSANSYLCAEPGLYKFTIEIPNPALMPGMYKISIGAVNKDNDFSEQRPSCLSFEVIDLESIRSERPGFIFMPVNWKLDHERTKQ